MEYLIWYFVIGIIIALVVKVDGGNLETEFYMKEYLKLHPSQIILMQIVFWLPLAMVFIYQLGRDR